VFESMAYGEFALKFSTDQPYGIEVFDKLGNLYTTTAHGSTNQLGAVIKLRP
jgi:hypothetical protein